MLSNKVYTIFSGDDSATTSTTKIYGIKNNGSISAKVVAGGVFGYVGQNVEIKAYDGIQNAIRNVGNVQGDIQSSETGFDNKIAYSYAGGIIGYLKVGTNNLKSEQTKAIISEDGAIYSETNVTVYTYEISNMFSGKFVAQTDDNINTYYVNQNLGSDKTYVSGDYASGIIGFISSTDHNDSLQTSAYITRDNKVADNFTKVIIYNAYNFASIGGETTTNASGILGGYANIHDLEFNHCMNSGEISCLNSSVGGIISTLGRNAESWNYNIYNKNHSLSGYEPLNEQFIKEEYIDGSVNTLSNVSFIKTINNSRGIGGGSQYDTASNVYRNRFAGGLFGYAYDVSINIDSSNSQGNISATSYIDYDNLQSYAGGLFGYAKLPTKEANNHSLTISTLSEYPTDMVKFAKDREFADDTYSANIVSADNAGGLIGALYSNGNVYGHISDTPAITNDGTDLNKTLEDLKNLQVYSANITRFTNKSLENQLVTVRGSVNSSGIIASFEGMKNSTLILTNIKNNAKVVGTNNATNLSGASGIIGLIKAKSVYLDNCTNNAEINGNDFNYKYGNSTSAGGLIGVVNASTSSDLQYVEINGCKIDEYALVTTGKTATDKVSAGGFIGHISDADTTSNISLRIVACSTVMRKDNSYGVVLTNNEQSITGAGGYIGSAEINRLIIGSETSIQNSSMTNVKGTTNVGGIIGYCGSKVTKIINTNVTFVQVDGSSSISGIGGFVGYVGGYANSSSVNTIYIYNTSNNASVINITTKYVGGAVIGVVNGTSTQVYIGEREEVGTISRLNFTANLNSVGSDLTIGGGVIGDLRNHLAVVIQNIRSSCTITTKIAGGIIGQFADSEKSDTSLVSIGGNKNTGTSVTITGSIGTNTSRYAGGVIGLFARTNYGNIIFNSIILDDVILTATEKIGGVIGYANNPKDNKLLNASTSSIELINVSYRGINNVYHNEYYVWNSEIDNNTKTYTLLLNQQAEHIEREEITYLDEQGNKIPGSNREVKSVVNKIDKYDGLYINDFDIENINFFIGNSLSSFSGTTTYNLTSRTEISIFLVSNSLEGLDNLAGYSLNHKFNQVESTTHEHKHDYSSFEEFRVSYDKTELEKCEQATSDDYQNTKTLYLVELTELDRSYTEIAVFKVKNLKLHKILLKK